jgi:hypothetical protein
MSNNDSQIELFGGATTNFEYYPVLIPDEAGMAVIASLNEVFKEYGVKQSGLSKLPHISIDGVVCPENDDKVGDDIKAFLRTQKGLRIEFSEMHYYPNIGGLTVVMLLKDDEMVKSFNKEFMTAIGGKITKLKLHLTLARYVKREIYDELKKCDLPIPQSMVFNGVAIYKKQVKAKGAYEVIAKIPFGEQ